MAQQQANITVAAPGFLGLNTEDSPLEQESGFATAADNAVVDRFGRIGSRKAWAEFTTANNLTYSTDPSTVRTEQIVNRLGQGVVAGVRTVLCSVSVFQYDVNDQLLQSDFFICKLNEPAAEVYELDEITLPSLTDASQLQDCQFVSFNDNMYVFSRGNECMKYNGTTMSLLFTGTIDVDYIPPTDDTGVLASTIDGDIATSAYGRLWVTGVGGDYETIYYSDLLLSNQWYDGRAAPVDALNTGGLINVSQYWPSGTDRIVAIKAHNNFLYVFGRQSVLIYTGMAEDPAGLNGATLQDTIPGIGLVSRDAVTNIGSDLLFVDDSGVRSMGRTIQEKSVPIGDLTANIRRDLSNQIATTADKTSISLEYWPDESLTVLLFADEGLAYGIEMRRPSPTGGNKITRWTDCRFNRTLYFEDSGAVFVLLAANQDDKGLLRYDSFLQYDGESYEFKYESTQFTWGQPANSKFLKQIDYTVVATQTDTTGYGGWGYNGRIEYEKSITIRAQAPALFGVAEFNNSEFGDGLVTIRRYKVNTKGRGESVVIGLRADIAGNSCSLQEINVQTLIGRLN